MRTFLTVLLAIVGIFFVARGTSALAQGSGPGYACTYNCTRLCGTYNCYPGSYTCDNAKQGSWLTQDATKLGGCVLASGTCNLADYTCNNTVSIDQCPNAAKSCTMTTKLTNVCKCS